MDIRSLGYVVIEAKDVSAWRSFGTDVVGMMIAPNMPEDGNVYLKMDERPFRWAVQPGNQDRLLLCGWELASQHDFERTKDRLRAEGVAFSEGSEELAAARQVQELISLQDPDGNQLELYWGAALDYAKFISPLGIDGFETGFNGDMGFGHVVLPSPNLKVTHRFYTELLGFGQVDYMHFHFNPDPNDPGQGLHFLHVNNPRHHSLALFQAEMPSGCVHLMVEVHSVDEVGYCLDRVQEREIPVVSTLGRHTNDRMLSFYMATPGGFALEFGTGGLKMDWDNYTPTVSKLPSIWGHKFQG